MIDECPLVHLDTNQSRQHVILLVVDKRNLLSKSTVFRAKYDRKKTIVPFLKNTKNTGVTKETVQIHLVLKTKAHFITFVPTIQVGHTGVHIWKVSLTLIVPAIISSR